MSFLDRIRDFFKSLRGKRPQIEAPKEEIIKETIEGNPDYHKVCERFYMPSEKHIENQVEFRGLSSGELNSLKRRIAKEGKKTGWIHSDKTTTTGYLGGQKFAAFQRINAVNNQNAYSICTDKEWHDIIISKENPNIGNYKAHCIFSDGTDKTFFTTFGIHDFLCYSTISKGKIRLTESATLDTGHQLDKEVTDSDPLIINIKIDKIDERNCHKKGIKYYYTSLDAYKNGERPYKLELKGYDDLEYETTDGEIKKWAGMMPTELSKEVDSVVKGEFPISPEILTIYRHAISKELDPNSSKIPEQAPDEPDRHDENADRDDWLKGLNVGPISPEGNVLFERLSEEEIKALVPEIRDLPGRLEEINNNNTPKASGKLDGQNFAVFDIVNLDVDFSGQTVCTENGCYDIITWNNDPKKGWYREHLECEDGTVCDTYIDFYHPDGEQVSTERSKGGITVREYASLDGYDPRKRRI